jgi:pimeloyl-ACP methyl ester carboxylesterase
MTRYEVGVDVAEASGVAEAHLAVSVHLPDAPSGTLVVAYPGAGYARGYWDIHWPGLEGYSQVEHHLARGWIVAAVDHLDVGSSSTTDGTLTLTDYGAADAAAAHAVAAGLRGGSLLPGVGPLAIDRVIGLGQSMGGHMVAVAQAGSPRTEGPFDAIALLGSSCLRTSIPTPDGELDLGDTDPTSEAGLAMMTAALTWAFHMEDEEPALREADLAGGYPARLGPVPDWGSATMPPVTTQLVVPGVIAAECAAIRVPVFLAFGERDLTPDPRAEPTAFTGSPDVTVVVIPDMAHMHNFARTRAHLWRRLETWVEGLPD